MYTINRDLIYEVLRVLAWKIEGCGASEKLTEASSLACDLASAIGNRYNKPNPYNLTTLIHKYGDQIK